MRMIEENNPWIPQVISNNDDQQTANNDAKISTEITGIRDKNKEIHSKLPVQPLLNQDDIDALENYFLMRKYPFKGLYRRDYTLVILALGTGRRAGDLLKLRYQDVVDEDKKIKTHLKIREGKTGKIATLILHPKVVDALCKYIESKDSINWQDYMFPNYKTGEPLSTRAYYRMLQEAKEALGFDFPFGTHSLRKTSARKMLDAAASAGVPSAIKMVSKEYLGHSNEEVTNRYLCFTQEEKDRAMLAMKI